MFVSSYNTYVHTNNSKKKTQELETNEIKSSPFKLPSINDIQTKNIKNIPQTPLNYISKGKTQYNKTILELQQKTKDSSKKNEDRKTLQSSNIFNHTATIKHASVAYKDASQKFPLLKNLHTIFNQTQQNDTTAIKEKNIRSLMIHTYTQNENYYLSYH
ncbi:MAG: hypothetical protein U9P38_01565 [Campylobacterota bacterium]|nr:hypothetical protein [Campylobacterota bacterium]